MEITSFSIWLFLIFTPGILSNLFLESLVPLKKAKDIAHLIIRCWLLGIASYGTYFVIGKTLGIFFGNLGILDIVILLQDPNQKPISFSILITASFFGFLNSLLLSKILMEKTVHKFCKIINVSKKLPDMDVWAFLCDCLNSNQWLVVRDPKNNLCYLGWIQNFSDSHFDFELLIRDVTVYYNNSGEYLYEAPIIYLSKDIKELSFEIYNQPKG